MLKLCVLATTLVAVICAPLDMENQPHVRVKRAGGEEPVLESDERSLLGYMPEDVKEAEEDQSAMVHTEVLPAEDTSTEPDVISSPKQQAPAEELMPTEPESQAVKEGSEEEGEEEKESQDLTESEEEDLQKLMSTEANENDIAVADSAESAADASEEDDKSAEITSSSPPTGRYSKLLYDLYKPYAYGRRRRAAPRAAATAEDMMMGGGMGGGEQAVLPGGPNPGTRRIKRDLNMDELRSLLKRGGEYLGGGLGGELGGDYPEYEDYPEYTDNQVEDIPESELLAEEIAREQGELDYPEEYPEYPEYEAALDDYYQEPNEVYPGEGYPDYEQGYEQGYLPEQDVDDLTLQQKLALMGYLEREELEERAELEREELEREELEAAELEAAELEAEGYDPYREYEPRYPAGVEETYEDLGPAGQEVYKRQYLSFVPGSKRSGSEREFYPSTDGWWRGLTDPLAEEQKRNDLEYERLMRLAAALNGPYDDEEWRKK